MLQAGKKCFLVEINEIKKHFYCFYDVSDYRRNSVASISLLIKWKNNNRKVFDNV